MASAKYLDTPHFPANSALGCPHILDIAKYKLVSSSEKIHVEDLIATILHKYHPSTLDRSLNLGKNFIFKNGKGNGPDFLIIRKGKTVKVSIGRSNPFTAYLTHQIFSCGYGNMKEPHIQDWLTRHVYRIGEQVSDKWTPVSYSVGSLEGKREEAVLEQGSAFVTDFCRNNDLAGGLSGMIEVRAGSLTFGD